MTVPLKRPYRPTQGLVSVVGRGDGLNELAMSMLLLRPGASYTGQTGDMEAALVILSGTCTVKADGVLFEEVGGRRDVFEGPGHTVYLPCGTHYEVEAHTHLEAVLGSTPTSSPGVARLIMPGEVIHSSRGVLNWRRDIWDVMTPRFPAERLVIVEVITPPGNWSSVPPHRHEQDRLPAEVRQEEIYFYRFKPAQGFAMQRVYTDDGTLDECVTARHNDAVIIPRGYHPVAVVPGYTCYYLNFLAGDLRAMAPCDDPQHAWLKACEATVREWSTDSVWPGQTRSNQ